MKQHEKCGYVYDFITKSSKKPKQNCKKMQKVQQRDLRNIKKYFI